MKRPRILVFDIETAPMLGYVWSLWENNVALNQLHTDWYVLSWAAKWVGETEVLQMDQRRARNMEDDRRILKRIWQLLDRADIVVTQNGKSFDVRKLNARFVQHGFQPPSSYKHVDVKQLAQRHFGFPSHKLEYMTELLCTKYKKLKHEKFSGFELWSECLARNPEAWDEMAKYNRHDVLSLEELYHKVQPWSATTNIGIYTGDYKPLCRCGSKDFKRQGWFYTQSGKYQRYRCRACGAETRDKRNAVPKAARQGLRMGTQR